MKTIFIHSYRYSFISFYYMLYLRQTLFMFSDKICPWISSTLPLAQTGIKKHRATAMASFRGEYKKICQARKVRPASAAEAVSARTARARQVKRKAQRRRYLLFIYVHTIDHLYVWLQVVDTTWLRWSEMRTQAARKSSVYSGCKHVRAWILSAALGFRQDCEPHHHCGWYVWWYNKRPYQVSPIQWGHKKVYSCDLFSKFTLILFKMCNI